MKHRIFFASIIGLLVLSATPIYAVDTNVNADDFFPEVEVQNVTKPSDEVGDVQFHADASTTIDETAHNDVYAISGTVDIKNAVEGDIFAAGSEITIEKTVSGSVRATGNSITINGTVKRNTLIFANTVVIGEKASLQGNVRIYANTLTMNGTISGTAHIQVKTLKGDGRYMNATEITLGNNNAAINSADTDRITITQGGDFPQVIIKGLKIVGGILSILVSAILGALIIVFGYPYAQRAATELRAQPLKFLGRGAVACAVVLCALCLLVITLIGIPFAIVGVFLLIFAGWVGKMLVAYAVGVALTRTTGSEHSTLQLIGIFLLGFVIITILTSIPGIGWLLDCVVKLLGIGVLSLSIKRSYGSL
ncbi:MAG: hypothetical protein KIH62_002765 [Candidatus Kerfeldbacteria bacterium]|nr:hypothetical protein [Candidatus Kerfeldbacteria bacterium]